MKIQLICIILEVVLAAILADYMKKNNKSILVVIIVAASLIIITLLVIPDDKPIKVITIDEGLKQETYIDSQPTTESMEPTSENYIDELFGIKATNRIGMTKGSDSNTIKCYTTAAVLNSKFNNYEVIEVANWHIMTQRYCERDNYKWYEIIDSQDYTYYGWIREDYLELY